MAKKTPEKKPEIPQPNPDIIFPDDTEGSDTASQAVVHIPTLHSEGFPLDFQSTTPQQQSEQRDGPSQCR